MVRMPCSQPALVCSKIPRYSSHTQDKMSHLFQNPPQIFANVFWKMGKRWNQTKSPYVLSSKKRNSQALMKTHNSFDSLGCRAYGTVDCSDCDEWIHFSFMHLRGHHVVKNLIHDVDLWGRAVDICHWKQYHVLSLAEKVVSKSCYIVGHVSFIRPSRWKTG